MPSTAIKLLIIIHPLQHPKGSTNSTHISINGTVVTVHSHILQHRFTIIEGTCNRNTTLLCCTSNKKAIKPPPGITNNMHQSKRLDPEAPIISNMLPTTRNDIKDNFVLTQKGTDKLFIINPVVPKGRIKSNNHACRVYQN